MHPNFEFFKCSGFSENSSRLMEKNCVAGTEIEFIERIEIVKLHED